MLLQVVKGLWAGCGPQFADPCSEVLVSDSKLLKDFFR